MHVILSLYFYWKGLKYLKFLTISHLNSSSDSQIRLSPDHWQNMDRRSTYLTKPNSSHLFISGQMLKQLTPKTKINDVNRKRLRVKRQNDEGDALSQNITMILEDLLKDYDKTERPAFKTGQIFILKICFQYYLYRFW